MKCADLTDKSDSIKCVEYKTNSDFLKITSTKLEKYPPLIVPKISMFYFKAKILSFIEDVDKIYQTSEFDPQEDYYKQEGGADQ